MFLKMKKNRRADMINYKLIIRDTIILMIFSSIFAFIFKLGFDQLRGEVRNDPLITATLQNNVDMMITTLSEDSFKKNPQGTATYEEYIKYMTNNQDEQGRTPLMWVSYINFNNRDSVARAEESRLVAARLFIDKSADISLKDEHGWTALTWASWTGFPNLVKLLIEKGADVNVADKRGQTPLMIAAIRGNCGVTAILLENGADKSLQNVEGKTAKDLATENLAAYRNRKDNYEEILRLLDQESVVREPAQETETEETEVKEEVVAESEEEEQVQEDELD
jgi:uncharacterized protein